MQREDTDAAVKKMKAIFSETDVRKILSQGTGKAADNPSCSPRGFRPASYRPSQKQARARSRKVRRAELGKTTTHSSHYSQSTNSTIAGALRFEEQE